MYLSFALQLIHNSSESTQRMKTVSHMEQWGVFKWEKMPSVIRAETTRFISFMAYSEQELGPAPQRKQVSALWAAHASSLPAAGKWRQAKSSGINLECCYTTCRTGIMLHWARGFEMKALMLLSNSIFCVCFVFIKGIKTNIPWEYKIPTKVISVNRGKKIRPHTTVISSSHTSQASYISTLFVFQKCWKSKLLLPVPMAPPEPALWWLGWVNTGHSCSKLLQTSNIQKYFYSNSSLFVTKLLQTTENRPSEPQKCHFIHAQCSCW